jgi:hypothetical protein
MLCLPYYAYVFFQQNQSQGQKGICLELRRGGRKKVVEGAVGEMTQTMYAHVNK